MAADQKRAAAESAWIVFFDESGISLIPPVRRTWSPRSRTPILRHRYHWKRASMAAALGDHADGTRARWCFHLQADSYDTDSLIKVLEQMAGFYTGHKVVLLWDGLSAHWSYKLRAHLDQQRDWLTVERLPAYAPELNAVEYLWANLKGTEPANFAGDTVAEVADQAQHGIQRVCASDSLVLGFLAQLARSSGRPGDQVRSRRGRRRLLACVGDGSTHGDDGPQQGGAMTATTDVLDLVQRWAAAEQGNDAQALEGLLAARPTDRWMLANAHIGCCRLPPAHPPSDGRGWSTARRRDGQRVRGARTIARDAAGCAHTAVTCTTGDKEDKMGRLIIHNAVTVNGAFEAPDPDKWLVLDADSSDASMEQFLLADAMVLGRKTYEGLAAVWPHLGDDPALGRHAERINTMPKYVASRTLRAPLEWNATLLEGDLTDSVRALKAKHERNLIVSGCGELAHALTDQGLVDEFWFWVNPWLWASGPRIFDGVGPVRLQLVASTAYPSGVVWLRYRPAADQQGTLSGA